MTFKGKIGCEVECIIKSSKIDEVYLLCENKHWKMTSDGSLNAGRGYHTKEIHVGVYSLDDKDRMFVDLKELFELINVNESCGLHIHLSFEKTSDYYKLLNWKFVDGFQNEIRKKFKTTLEIGRLNNSYCHFYNDEKNFIYHTNIQVKNYGKVDRYWSVNFNSFNLVKTIEFRIFAPTNSITKFKNYFNLLTKQVDGHLKNTKFETIDLKIKHKKISPLEINKPKVIKTIITKKELLDKEQSLREQNQITNVNVNENSLNDINLQINDRRLSLAQIESLTRLFERDNRNQDEENENDRTTN